MQQRQRIKPLAPPAPPGGWHIVRWKAAKKGNGEIGYVLSPGGVRTVATITNSNSKAPKGGILHKTPWAAELRIPSPAGKEPFKKFNSQVEARAWVESQLKAFLVDIGFNPAKQRHSAWQQHHSKTAASSKSQPHQPKLAGLL